MASNQRYGQFIYRRTDICNWVDCKWIRCKAVGWSKKEQNVDSQINISALCNAMSCWWSWHKLPHWWSMVSNISRTISSTGENEFEFINYFLFISCHDLMVYYVMCRSRRTSVLLNSNGSSVILFWNHIVRFMMLAIEWLVSLICCQILFNYYDCNKLYVFVRIFNCSYWEIWKSLISFYYLIAS